MKCLINMKLESIVSNFKVIWLTLKCVLTALLIEQLTAGTYECMVCCDTIRGQNAVWSCNGCYHIFHLRCIKTWAKSPTARIEGGYIVKYGYNNH